MEDQMLFPTDSCISNIRSLFELRHTMLFSSCEDNHSNCHFHDVNLCNSSFPMCFSFKSLNNSIPLNYDSFIHSVLSISILLLNNNSVIYLENLKTPMGIDRYISGFNYISPSSPHASAIARMADVCGDDGQHKLWIHLRKAQTSTKPTRSVGGA